MVLFVYSFDRNTILDYCQNDYLFGIAILMLAIDCWDNAQFNGNKGKLQQKIIFLEGTSGIGKTTCANVSFDFVHFIEQCGIYARKNELPYIQALYETMLRASIELKLQQMIDENKCVVPSPIICDRCIISQLAYGILFHFRGEKINPKQFIENVETQVFLNESIVKEIHAACNAWLMNLQNRFPECQIDVFGLGASDIPFTVDLLKTRGGFENAYNYELTWYVINQNYIFEKLFQIARIGRFIYTKHIMLDEQLLNVSFS